MILSSWRRNTPTIGTSKIVPPCSSEDVEIHGTKIPKGSRVRFVLSSANRDSRRFDRADEFDLTRNPVDLRNMSPSATASTPASAPRSPASR